MNLENLKVNATGSITVLDSLNASLLKMKITLNSNTIIPNNKDLIIKVNKEEEGSDNLKEYIYILNDKLNFNNDLSDEFIIEPIISENKVKMVAYVNRKTNNTTEKEVLEYLPITLFDGKNYISTNYENADIELIYPKNEESIKYFLNHSIYNEDQKELEILKNLYFKDAFTKTEDNINLDINNLNVNCITSKNNKFNLDSEGNLTVNSITTVTNNTLDIDTIYPVGSIYMNVNDINPADLFGGVWEQIKDRFLLASGDTFSLGSSGGEKEHTLTLEEIPAHTHEKKTLTGKFWNYRGQDNKYTGTASGICSMTKTDSYAPYSSGGTVANGKDTLYINATHEHSSVGKNQSHNNMPPYLAVKVYKRVA